MSQQGNGENNVVNNDLQQATRYAECSSISDGRMHSFFRRIASSFFFCPLIAESLMNPRRKKSLSSPHVLLFTAGALTCIPALAAEGDVFTPYASYGVYHDGNLLRNPDYLGKESDTWTRAAVGVKFDKDVGRQELTADLSANHSDYDRFNQFDNTGKELQANWKWALGNLFSGNVGTSYSEALTPIEDFRSLEPNIRTQTKNYVDASWRLHPSWQLNAGYSRYDLRYDLESQKPSERNLDIADFGFDYLARSGNKVGIVFRHMEGDYPAAPINSYDQNEVKAKVDWQLTGKTWLQFLGGWSKREYNTNAQRDSSEPSARLTAYWKATGKTAFSVGAWREIGATDDLAANYALNQGVSLGATWDATYKISVDGLIMTEKRDYNGVSVVEGISPLDRNDRYHNAVLGVTYKPTPHWRIRTSIYRAKLDSNIASEAYTTDGILLTTRYEF